MKTQTCLITNGTNGVGFEIAKAMAQKGYRVIITCKDESCGSYSGRLIMEMARSIDVDVLKVQFNSLESINNFNKELNTITDQIDIFINTLGLTQFNTENVNSFLPSFLLTNLLVDYLQKSENGRIIFVNNTPSKEDSFHLENLVSTIDLNPRDARNQLSVANAALVQKLAGELERQNITVNSISIGNVKGLSNNLFNRMADMLMNPFRRKARKAILPVVDLAIDPQFNVKSGRFFMKYKEIKEVSLAYEEKIKDRLWQISQRLTGLYQTKKEYAVQLAS